MSLLETIKSAQGGRAIGNLARHCGLDESQTELAVRALAPEIGRAMRGTSESRTGAAAMHAVMEDERYARYADDPAALDDPGARAQGESLLREIFGSSRNAREVADGVARSSSLDVGAIERLQPLVALIAAGALGRQVRESSPTMPGRFGTRPEDEDVGGAPLARALASLFGDEDVSIGKKP